MKNLVHLQKDSDFQNELAQFVKKHFVAQNRRLLEIYRSANRPAEFPGNFPNKWTDLRPLFREKQNSRCAICEKELNDVNSTDIEHYRPKTHYWWLAYNPANYYLTCAECNRICKNKSFPLYSGQIAVTYNSRKQIEDEEPLLINPLKDDPNTFFMLAFVIHRNSNKGIMQVLPRKNLREPYKTKAEKTIEIYNLDLQRSATESEKSRFRLLHRFYNDLHEIAYARKHLSKEKFREELKTRLHYNPALKTLDILQFIVCCSPDNLIIRH